MRLARQLTLPERRTLRNCVELLQVLDHGGGPRLTARLQAARCMAVPPLPPLAQEETDLVPVDVGSEALFQSAKDGEQRVGVRFLGFGDLFAGPRPQGRGPLPTTPSCRLAVRAIELQ